MEHQDQLHKPCEHAFFCARMEHHCTYRPRGSHEVCTVEGVVHTESHVLNKLKKRLGLALQAEMRDPANRRTPRKKGPATACKKEAISAAADRL